MGNLFSPIETKICKKCGHEKPLLAFPKKQVKNGVLRYECYCKGCFGAIMWARMGEQTRENKRAFDRAQLAKEQGKDRLRRANEKRTIKNNELRTRKKAEADARWLHENIGAYSVMHWHTCARCKRVRLHKHKEYEAELCSICIRAELNRGRRNIIKPKQVECCDCGTTHIALFANQRCPACKDALRAQTNRANRAKYGKGARDRARRYGCHYEPVNRLMVYKRDKYKCYLCGIKVVVSSGYSDNMATLDHVIPLNCGGSHTYDNVKTCCGLCNSKKMDKVKDGEQISLFCSVRRASNESGDRGIGKKIY